MRARLRLGLVGCGAISQSYVQAVQQSDEASINAVADERFEVARSLAEQLGCAAHDGHDGLLEAACCDALIVCTPPATHRGIVLDTIARGIPVLCEKPLSLDTASAREMIEAAKAEGTALCMSSKFRHVEDVIQAKSIVAAGTLGKLILFENTFASYVDMTSRWNSDPAISGGGVLIDNGTHSVDLIRYFLGPITEIHAMDVCRIQEIPVEDTVRILTRNDAGVMGSIDLSWSISKATSSYVDIYGSHGTLRIGWRESRYRKTGSADWVVFGRGYDKIQAFRRLIDDFCLAVRGEKESLISPQDTFASVEAVEAAYESLRVGNWTPVGRQGRTAPATPLSARSGPA